MALRAGLIFKAPGQQLGWQVKRWGVPRRLLMMVNQADITRYLENWQDEIESAFLYRALADVEPQPTLAEVYRRLATTEETHAQFWEEKLLQVGHRIPRRRIGWRTKLLAWMAKRFGPQFVLPTVNAME